MPRYWASYGVVTQLVFLLGWVGVSCLGKSVRQLCRVLRWTGSSVAALKPELRVTAKTDF